MNEWLWHCVLMIQRLQLAVQLIQAASQQLMRCILEHHLHRSPHQSRRWIHHWRKTSPRMMSATLLMLLSPLSVCMSVSLSVCVFYSNSKQLDYILHEHVSWQRLGPDWISRSSVRGQGHTFFFALCAWHCGYPWTVLSLEQGLMTLWLWCFMYFQNVAATVDSENVLTTIFQIAAVTTSAPRLCLDLLFSFKIIIMCLNHAELCLMVER